MMFKFHQCDCSFHCRFDTHHIGIRRLDLDAICGEMYPLALAKKTDEEDNQEKDLLGWKEANTQAFAFEKREGQLIRSITTNNGTCARKIAALLDAFEGQKTEKGR